MSSTPSHPRVAESMHSMHNGHRVQAYRILAATMAAALLGASVLTDARVTAWTVEPHHMQAGLFAFVALAATLPSMLIAWTEREL
ncbi:MAG: hypothetical protein H0U69_11020 [Trueperaceae bacterium]|nr:hypothetical protein [Trueperaceae bacterium]